MTKRTSSAQTHRIFTGVRLPPILFEQLTAYIDTHRFKPTRTEIIETAIREFLEREGAIAPVSSPPPVASQSASALSEPASASP